MKDALIRFVLCSSFALGVLTARPCPALSQGQDAQAGRADSGAASSIEDQLRVLTEKLQLTQDQQAQIKAILEEEQQQLQAETHSGNLSPADRTSNRGRIRTTANSKIRDLLNDDQKAKFDQMEKERRTRAHPKKESSGSQLPK